MSLPLGTLLWLASPVSSRLERIAPEASVRVDSGHQTPFVAGGRLAALLTAAFACASAGADPDLWGHLTFGRDILQTRHVIAADPYSFTQDVPWVNHEWLSEVLFAAAYDAAGVFGLVLLKTVILTGTLSLVWVTLRSVQPPTIRWWLMALVTMCITPASLTFRPQLWTLLALPLLLMVLTGPGPPWRAIPLFAVWANLHGGWIVGAGVAGAWLVGTLLDGVPARQVLRTGTVLATAVLATVLNPYGAGLWRFLAETVRMTRAITEWRPVWEQTELSWTALWALLVLVLAVVVRKRKTTLSWSSILPVGGMCLGALLVSRLGPLFALASTLVWRETVHGRDQVNPPRNRVSRPAPFWIVDFTGVVAMWLIAATATGRCLPVTGSWSPDLAAAGALNGASAGKLVLPFDWGEYAIWHWGPRLRVFSDGRRETVYSQRMIDLEGAVSNANPDGVAYVLEAQPEYVWLKQSAGRMRVALRENGYRIDVSTPESFIAVRRDLAVLKPGSPMSACFP